MLLVMVSQPFNWLDAFSILANVYGGKCRNFVCQTAIVTKAKQNNWWKHPCSCQEAFGFKFCSKQIVDNTNALEMLVESYWEDKYFGRQRRNRRAEPRFAYDKNNFRLRGIAYNLKM